VLEHERELIAHGRDRNRRAAEFRRDADRGTGHFLLMEKPAEFNRALEDFLTRIGC
jgi:pimeloyl-ACP methyl ester carboxylesterase